MIRLVPLLALAVALPAFADLQKCAGPQGTTIYTDKPCPATATPAAAPVPAHAAAGAAPVDAPLEILETGVPVIVQMAGRFAWLDDDTLAITTFADPNAKAPWMVRKIVAYDVPAHAASTLVARGFIDCSNAGYNLVSLETGDLESRFAIGSRAAPPVQQFEIWNPAAHPGRRHRPSSRPRGNPSACMKPAAEALALHDLAGSRKPVRYLQPEHGTVVWGALDDSGHPAGPTLVTPKKKVALAANISDISHDACAGCRSALGYQLAPGAHMTGHWIRRATCR